MTREDAVEEGWKEKSEMPDSPSFSFLLPPPPPSSPQVTTIEVKEKVRRKEEEEAPLI